MGIVVGIVALIVAAALGYLVYHFVIARWILAVIILVVAIVLLARHLLTEAEERAALSRIDASQITLQLNFSPAQRGTYSPSGRQRYKVTGRLFNNSNEYTLTEVGLKVRIEDCAGDEGNSCIVVSEAGMTIDITIPPNQARDFTQEVLMPDFKPRGEAHWVWDVEYIRAE